MARRSRRFRDRLRRHGERFRTAVLARRGHHVPWVPFGEQFAPRRLGSLRPLGCRKTVLAKGIAEAMDFYGRSLTDVRLARFTRRARSGSPSMIHVGLLTFCCADTFIRQLACLAISIR